MSCDVLQEYESRSSVANDSGDLRPEVSGVVLSESLAGLRKRLAGVAGSDKIHSAAPRLSVEGSQVVPDRSLIQGLRFHPGHERGRRSTIPLDETDGANGVSERDSKPKLESTEPGT